MARASYISEEDRMVMRIGVAEGVTLTNIAKYLGRGRVVVSRHVSAMKKAGTIGELPLAFVAEPIAKALKGVK